MSRSGGSRTALEIFVENWNICTAAVPISISELTWGRVERRGGTVLTVLRRRRHSAIVGVNLFEFPRANGVADRKGVTADVGEV